MAAFDINCLLSYPYSVQPRDAPLTVAQPQETKLKRIPSLLGGLCVGRRGGLKNNMNRKTLYITRITTITTTLKLFNS